MEIFAEYLWGSKESVCKPLTKFHKLISSSSLIRRIWKLMLCFPSMCFHSGSVRYIRIWSVLYHWVPVNFVFISELKIQFTPTKTRGWCSGDLEEGSETEIEFQALRIDFSPPLWCWASDYNFGKGPRKRKARYSSIPKIPYFSWMHSSLTSNTAQDNQDTKMWQITRKESLAKDLRRGQWCRVQVLCFRSRRRYPLSNCPGASERFPRMLNTLC